MKPFFLPVFSGCTVPSGRLATLGTPSGSEVAVPGMLKAIQCSTSLVVFCMATSGSCMIRAKLCVPFGTSVQDRWGETGAALAWVYLSGMTAPSAKDELLRPMRLGAGACAMTALLDNIRAHRKSERERNIGSSVECWQRSRGRFRCQVQSPRRDRFHRRGAAKPRAAISPKLAAQMTIRGGA